MIISFVAIVCSAGDVRLVGGTEGTVEICSMSLWGLISATNWVDINAEVVCGELGYQSAGKFILQVMKKISKQKDVGMSV